MRQHPDRVTPVGGLSMKLQRWPSLAPALALILVTGACRRASKSERPEQAGPSRPPPASAPAAPDPIPPLPPGCELVMSINLDAFSRVEGLQSIVPAVFESAAAGVVTEAARRGGEALQGVRRMTICKSGVPGREQPASIVVSGALPANMLDIVPGLSPPRADASGLRQRGAVWFGQDRGRLVMASTMESARAVLVGPHVPYELQKDAMLTLVASGLALRNLLGGQQAVQVAELNAITNLSLVVDPTAVTLTARATVPDAATATKLADRLRALLEERRKTGAAAGLGSFTAEAQGTAVVLRGPIPPPVVRALGTQVAQQMERSLKQAAGQRAIAAAAN
jgi:hypothetical protein